MAATTDICYIDDQKLLLVCLSESNEAYPVSSPRANKHLWHAPSRHIHSEHEPTCSFEEFCNEHIAKRGGPEQQCQYGMAHKAQVKYFESQRTFLLMCCKGRSEC